MDLNFSNWDEKIVVRWYQKDYKLATTPKFQMSLISLKTDANQQHFCRFLLRKLTGGFAQL